MQFHMGHIHVLMSNIHTSYIPIKYLAFICNLVGIFVSGMTITYEVHFVVSCVSVDICTSIGSIYHYRIKTV